MEHYNLIQSSEWPPRWHSEERSWRLHRRSGGPVVVKQTDSPEYAKHLKTKQCADGDGVAEAAWPGVATPITRVPCLAFALERPRGLSIGGARGGGRDALPAARAHADDVRGVRRPLDTLARSPEMCIDVDWDSSAHDG